MDSNLKRLLQALPDIFPEHLYQGGYIVDIAKQIEFEELSYRTQCELVAAIRFMKEYNITPNQFDQAEERGLIKFIWNVN